MVIYAKKTGKSIGVMYSRSDGLHYFYAYGLGIMIYGKTIEEAAREFGKVFEGLREDIKAGEVTFEMLKKREGLKNRLSMLFGRFFACSIDVVSKNKTRELDEAASEVGKSIFPHAQKVPSS